MGIMNTSALTRSSGRTFGINKLNDAGGSRNSQLSQNLSSEMIIDKENFMDTSGISEKPEESLNSMKHKNISISEQQRNYGGNYNNNNNNILQNHSSNKNHNSSSSDAMIKKQLQNITDKINYDRMPSNISMESVETSSKISMNDNLRNIEKITKKYFTNTNIDYDFTAKIYNNLRIKEMENSLISKDVLSNSPEI